MNRPPRFFLPPADWAAGEWRLDEEESHHGIRVLRVRPGQQVAVFDGAGREAPTEVAAVEGGTLVLRPAQGTRAPAAAPLALVVAVPKARGLEWIIEKAVELGVAAVHPVITARTITRIPPAEAAERQRKWRRLALEACKQCGQNHLPEVAPPMAFTAFLASGRKWPLQVVGSLEPGTPPLRKVLATAKNPSAAALLIGPEGDLTDEEYGAARAAGWQPASFGPLTLRVETAALYGLSILRHTSQEWTPAT